MALNSSGRGTFAMLSSGLSSSGHCISCLKERGRGREGESSSRRRRIRSLTTTSRQRRTGASRTELSRRVLCQSGSNQGSSSSNKPVLPARARILKGTQLVQSGKLKEAVAELEPLTRESALPSLTEEEAGAATYNLACAYSRLGQFDKAGVPLTRAVNDYGIRYKAVLEDQDLEPFRMSRYFDEIQNNLKGSVGSDAQYAKMRVEARTPFRSFRLFALGSLDVGAGLGLLIILSRLVQALKGGENAPELGETLKNLGINVTAVVALTFFFLRDLKSSQTQLKTVQDEEEMGKLQVDLGANRVVPLSRLRQQYRPLILLGDETFIKKCVKAANQNKRDLQSKGVLLVPLLEEEYSWRRSKSSQNLSDKSTKGFDSSNAQKGAEASLSEAMQTEQRWVVQPREREEWVRWLNAQKEESDAIKYADNMYVQVQLDGTIKSMGPGTPEWKEILKQPDREEFKSKVVG